MLDRHLEGEDVQGPHANDVPPFQPLYDGYVAAGLPHGAPVPGLG
ncbi:hypothetical protein ACIB24_18600 [Spongisporangium articulatum]|uniref:Uncharacterized protein n=1 Tax=Spongisporangium articulatum TaxID=3362603 RepID=A0ABW8ARS9_9ACTN